MIANALKGKMLVFAVFFLGMVTGALLINVYETRLKADAREESNGGKAQQEMGQFFDYLALSSEQRQQWTEIMQESQPEYDKLFAENRKLTEPTRPRFEALREQTRTRIRTILTEEQVKKYNEFNERQRQRRQSQSRPK